MVLTVAHMPAAKFFGSSIIYCCSHIGAFFLVAGNVEQSELAGANWRDDLQYAHSALGLLSATASQHHHSHISRFDPIWL